jgi:two-component system sensor histidine kinase SenX3
MRARRLTLRLLLPIALLVLVGVLAWLQYRWLGQVGTAEREELRASLERRGQDLANDFDREFATLHDVVRRATDGSGQLMPAGVPEAIDVWRRSARYPQLISRIYLGDRGGNAALHRYDESTRSFVPAAWPSDWPEDLTPLTSMRRTTDQTMPAPARTEIVTLRPPLILTDPLLYVVWLPTKIDLGPVSDARAKSLPFLETPAGRFVAIALDRQVMTETVLPALIARHFGGSRIKVAVTDASGRTVYSTAGADATPLTAAAADVRVSFLGGMPEFPSTAAPGAMLTWASKVVGRDTPVGSVEQHSTVAVRVQRRVSEHTDIVTGLARPWSILVQHEAGSLEAAVAAGRRRNLWLGFGILAVLVAGMGLVVGNARRSERLAAQQVDFVAAVSHELRTPLSVIRSAAQNLSSGVVHELSRTREYGHLIEKEGIRLTEMVEQVLGYAGIDALGRGVTVSEVDVPSTLDAAIDSCASMLAERGIEVNRRVDPETPFALVNEPALRRALQNMISNAVKYAADGRWIGLRVDASNLRGRPAVSIVVADRGPGIDPSDLAHVFEPFYRGRVATGQQIQGSGIGLSLVKKVAEAHGGQVSVESSDSGTTFTLQLPAAAPGGSVRSAGLPRERRA